MTHPSHHRGTLTARDHARQSLRDGTFDLLVIGGGIVGAGIARDAALRGLKVALVEKHDFAAGTSSRSSRLLHGGLRYLAQGRVRLVREASVEKTILHRIAPHLAAPLPFVFPTYADNHHWKLWQLKIGVKLYDLLCSGRNLGQSTSFSATQLSKAVPGLKRRELRGAVRYFDALTNDARLVFDTLRSAAKAGATLTNYCCCQNAERNETGWRCEIQDMLSNEVIAVQAAAVVNATGPWADGFLHSAVKLRVTKGVHLVVARALLDVPEAVVMSEGTRILFAIPWGDRTILGTTDTDYSGRPEDVSVEPADVKYVLSVANKFFPAAAISPSDVISSWAGLRPLLADPDGKPHDISRSHEIKSPQPGWWDVAGGKLTTYRLMAEQAVDRIVAARGDARRFGPSRTASEPLLPASQTQNCSGILPPEFSRRLVEHYCANEWAVHLDDVMIRRTSWHYYHSDALEKASHVGNWMGELLGWTDPQRQAELQRYQALTGLFGFGHAWESTTVTP